eukprot:scaffold117694_cov20-Tisochrysis_lutea.AAC.1
MYHSLPLARQLIPSICSKSLDRKDVLCNRSTAVAAAASPPLHVAASLTQEMTGCGMSALRVQMSCLMHGPHGSHAKPSLQQNANWMTPMPCWGLSHAPGFRDWNNCLPANMPGHRKWPAPAVLLAEALCVPERIRLKVTCTHTFTRAITQQTLCLSLIGPVSAQASDNICQLVRAAADAKMQLLGCFHPGYAGLQC